MNVLGELEVVGAGGPVAVRALKLRQLLGALVISGGEVRSADWLAEAVWGESRPASADKLLQVYVSRLRKLLPADLPLVTRGDGYVLELEPVALDAVRFERLSGEGCRALREGNPLLSGSLLRRALSLWRGRAYGELADHPFASLDAARLEELRLVAVEDRIEADLAAGRHQQLIAEVCGLADRDPLRERLQAQAMLCLYRTGRHTEALERFTQLRATLDRELGLEPGPAVGELQRQILHHDPSLAAPPVIAAPTALPASPSVLVGRERELPELGELLDSDAVRLIVLTGAGGTGKTRLALEAARRHADRFANGVAFVALAAVRDVRRVPAAIANAVGIEDLTPSPLSQLVEHLAGLELLLVVDNLEHLREAGPALVTILERAPHVTVLATSRAVLHLTGEHVYPVRPLVPTDATALFRARARAANATLGPAKTEEAVVAQICERLDRLPLAIELAASRTRILSLPELLAGLAPRLPLLTAGPRDLPARQQTMSATVAWSHDLLDGASRRVFRRLSVFANGCSFEAARSVCESSMESVATLVDDNLLQCTVTSGGSSRYWMLETVREYAAERLRAAGEADGVGARHLEHFSVVAEACHLFAEAELAQDFATANDEQENFRAAIAWARAHGRTQAALQLVVALENFWVTHDPAEGSRLLGELTGPSHDLPVGLRARALRALGGSRQAMGELEVAEELFRNSRDLFAELDDVKGIAILDYRVGLIMVQRGDTEGGAILLEQSLASFQTIGSSRGEAQVTGALGTVARARGDRATARRLFERSALMCEQIGRSWWQAGMLAELAELALEDGDVTTCTGYARRLLELSSHIGERELMRDGLLYLACAAARSTDLEWAGRICGAVLADGVIPEDFGVHAGHIEEIIGDGDPRFDQGRRVGASLSLAAVVEEALGGAPVGG